MLWFGSRIGFIELMNVDLFKYYFTIIHLLFLFHWESNMVISYNISWSFLYISYSISCPIKLLAIITYEYYIISCILFIYYRNRLNNIGLGLNYEDSFICYSWTDANKASHGIDVQCLSFSFIIILLTVHLYYD